MSVGHVITFVDWDGHEVVLTAVPEPSTLAMLLGLSGIGLLGYLRRRWRWPVPPVASSMHVLTNARLAASLEPDLRKMTPGRRGSNDFGLSRKPTAAVTYGED